MQSAECEHEIHQNVHLHIGKHTLNSDDHKPFPFYLATLDSQYTQQKILLLSTHLPISLYLTSPSFTE